MNYILKEDIDYIENLIGLHGISEVGIKDAFERMIKSMRCSKC